MRPTSLTLILRSHLRPSPSSLSIATLPLLRSVSSFSRPGPPPLPPTEQREFEALQKAAETVGTSEALKRDAAEREKELQLHPNTRRDELREEFEGDVNPQTGEVGGPKREPLRWGAGGEWGFAGRATDL